MNKAVVLTLKVLGGLLAAIILLLAVAFAAFHTDAVQAIGHLKINVVDENIDMLSASAHKFHGPKGIGVLYAKRGIVLDNVINGGAQERGKRAGTENIPAIMGMAAALEEAFAWQSEHYDTSFYEDLNTSDYVVSGYEDYKLHVELLKNQILLRVRDLSNNRILSNSRNLSNRWQVLPVITIRKTGAASMSPGTRKKAGLLIWLQLIMAAFLCPWQGRRFLYRRR